MKICDNSGVWNPSIPGPEPLGLGVETAGKAMSDVPEENARFSYHDVEYL